MNLCGAAPAGTCSPARQRLFLYDCEGLLKGSSLTRISKVLEGSKQVVDRPPGIRRRAFHYSAPRMAAAHLLARRAVRPRRAIPASRYRNSATGTNLNPRPRLRNGPDAIGPAGLARSAERSPLCKQQRMTTLAIKTVAPRARMSPMQVRHTQPHRALLKSFSLTDTSARAGVLWLGQAIAVHHCHPDCRQPLMSWGLRGPGHRVRSAVSKWLNRYVPLPNPCSMFLH